MLTSFVRKSCATGSAITTMRSTLIQQALSGLPKAATTITNHPVMMMNAVRCDTPQRRSFSDDTTTATIDLGRAFEVCIVILSRIVSFVNRHTETH